MTGVDQSFKEETVCWSHKVLQLNARISWNQRFKSSHSITIHIPCSHSKSLFSSMGWQRVASPESSNWQCLLPGSLSFWTSSCLPLTISMFDTSYPVPDALVLNNVIFNVYCLHFCRPVSLFYFYSMPVQVQLQGTARQT